MDIKLDENLSRYLKPVLEQHVYDVKTVYDELFSTPAGGKVGLANFFGNGGGHRAEHLISNVMAEFIVNSLEVGQHVVDHRWK